MRTLLLAVAAIVVCHQTAAAYWPTTGVTRGKAEREKLPLVVAVTPLGDGTLQVKYQVTLTGPFAHLRSAEVLAADGDEVFVEQVSTATAEDGTRRCSAVGFLFSLDRGRITSIRTFRNDLNVPT